MVFEEATAAAPITAPSHATIFTGLYPPEHGLRSNGAFHLAPERRTLAELLKAAGYRTGAAIGAFPLASSAGFAQGFDVYDEKLGEGDEPERPAAAVADAALRVLAELRPPGSPEAAPFFLFAHFFDVHADYAPPPDLALPDPYDGEVAYVDRELGRLLDALPPDTVVVVLGDHGEGLGEHGEDGHAVFVYQSTLHVPLLLRHPDLPPRRVAAPVSLADVTPTLLDLLGLPAVEGASGTSLVAAARGEPLADRPLFFESRMPALEFRWAPLDGIRLGKWKLVRAPRRELYDLAADPGETTNLWSPGAARELEARLSALEGSRWPEGGASATAPLPEADREKLAALGYLGAGATMAPGADAPDPKDKMEVLRRMSRAVALLDAGDLAESEQLYRAVLDEEPGNTIVAKGLARALAGQGKLPEASDILATAITGAADPLKGSLLVDRAGVLRRLGDAPAAEREARLALELSGPSARASVILAHALEDQSRTDEALRLLADAAAARPDDADLLVARAEILLRLSRPDEATRDLEASLAREPRHGRAHYDLGLLALRAGLQDEAATHLEAAHDAPGDPIFRKGADPEARYVLAVALSRRDRFADATRLLRQLADEVPDNAAVWNALGTAIARSGDTASSVASFRRAVLLAPDNPAYRENLANATSYDGAPRNGDPGVPAR